MLQEINANGARLSPSLARLLFNQMRVSVGYGVDEGGEFRCRQEVYEAIQECGLAVGRTLFRVPVTVTESVPTGTLSYYRDGVLICELTNIGVYQCQ